MLAEVTTLGHDKWLLHRLRAHWGSLSDGVSAAETAGRAALQAASHHHPPEPLPVCPGVIYRHLGARSPHPSWVAAPALPSTRDGHPAMAQGLWEPAGTGETKAAAAAPGRTAVGAPGASTAPGSRGSPFPGLLGEVHMGLTTFLSLLQL